MISSPPSPIFTASRSILGRPYPKNENLALSPKRSFAQHHEDQLEPKRRHVHPDAQPARRTPLYPLSALDLENRTSRGSRSTDPTSYHSLATPPSLADFRVLHQPSNSGIRRSNASAAPVCSWPPPMPTAGAGRSLPSSLTGQCASLDSSGGKKSTRGIVPESISISAWHAPDVFQPGPTRTTGWRSETVLKPIRSRTSSMPSIRRPSEELWRSDSGPTIKVPHEPVDTTRLLSCPAPPGLPPRRPELRRSGSVSELLPHGSVSLSLAHGSQPLRASEHTKAVPPIGAERSRVVSITSTPTRNFPVTATRDPANPPWCSPPPSPKLDPTWINLLNTTSLEKAQAETGRVSMSKEDLERLLRHTVRNKHAPKITSPLSPLRTIPVLDTSADLAYRLRTSSQSNNLSLRYSKCPPRRVRTVCDGHQSFDWDITCMHCQECQRDTVCKRLLAFRFRQRQVQRNKLHACPVRGATVSVVEEEEKSLWDEVAAITGGGSLPFSRVGAPPCAVAAPYRRSADDGVEDGVREGPSEMRDEGLLANGSATLFRDVSVY